MNKYAFFFADIASHKKEINKIQFEDIIKTFEQIIGSILESNIEIIRKLDILIDKNNPSLEDVDELITLLINPSHSQYFFTRLKSPQWLELLIQKEFYKEPKQESVDSSQLVHVWPQINYLINISAIRPEKILSIIDNFEEIVDVTIFRSILMCLNNMPVKTSRKALPFIKKWVKKFFRIPELTFIKKILNNFIFENELDTAFDLINYIFDVRIAEKKGHPIDDESISFLLSEFEGIVEQLIKIDTKTEQPRFVELLLNSLEKILKIEFHKNEPFEDYSELWRRDIQSKKSIYESGDTKNILINHICSYFIEIGSKSEKIVFFKKCIEILGKYPSKVFIRIKLFVMERFSKIFSNQIKLILSQEDLFYNNGIWSEYYVLLKNNFSLLNEEEKNIIFEWIRKGPDLSKFNLTVDDFTEKNEYINWKNGRISSWIRRRAEPIKEYLPEDLKIQYENLVIDDGEIKNPQYYREMNEVRFSTGTPLETSELMNLDFNELILYLNSWNPDKNDFFSSKEGLGSEITRLISENPKKYEILLERLIDIPILYVSYITNGFSLAIEKKKEFNIIEGLENIINIFHKYKSDYEFEDYSDMSRELLRIFDQVLNIERIELNKNLLENIFNNISYFLKIDSNILQESQLPSEYVDYVNYSINTLKGKAISTFISYALHQAKKVSGDQRDRMVNEVKATLDYLMNPNLESVEIFRSILAFNISKLFYMSESWVRAIIYALFPIDNMNLWKIAWESYISYNNLNQKIYEILKDHYEKAVIENSNLSLSTKSIEGLAGHIMLLYFYDLANLEKDSIVSKFFDIMDIEARSRAMWFVLRIWDNHKNTNLESKFLSKILTIWSYRIEFMKTSDSLKFNEYFQELRWYALLFDKLPVGESQLSLLIEVLDIMGGEVGASGIFLIDAIRKYIDINPYGVLQVIELYCKKTGNMVFLIGNVNKIITIINDITEKNELDNFKEIIWKITNILLEYNHYEIKEAPFFKKLNI